MENLDPGTVFAGHRIEGVAGRGGVGVVYRATHLALDHVVALKVIAPALATDPAWRARFVAESRAAVSIRHPNVVPVHHAGEEDGQLFVTMDLIEGTDLRQLLRGRGSLEPAHAVEILTAVASALDAAHERGLVHRDVKPSNILIELDPESERADGRSGRVFLTDFGLTKSMDSSADVTATGAFVGTIDYVAPEQIQGERLDARTDVYALGCVLYEMLGGQAPYAHLEEKVAKLYAHLREPPLPLTERMPGTPRDFDAVVERALAKESGERYASAGDLARAAEGALKGVTTLEVGSVATGEAAPVAAAPVADEPEATEVLETQPSEAQAEGERRVHRGWWLVAAITAATVAIVILVVSGGGESGSDRRPANATAIPFGGMPVAIASDDGQVWIGRRTQDSVSLVDPADTVGLGVGSAPEGLTLGPQSVWVALQGTDKVARIDRDTHDEIVQLEVGDEPRDVAHEPGAVWVTNGADDTVTLIDPLAENDTGAVVDTIDVGDEPHGVALSEGAVWVTNRAGDSVSRIDSASAERTVEEIPVGPNPKGIAVDSGTVWVANTGEDDVDDGSVTPIDLDSGEAEAAIDVGGDPRGVAVGVGSIWVANGAGYLTQLSPEGEIVATWDGVGSSPEEVAVDGDEVWVTDGQADQIIHFQP